MDLDALLDHFDGIGCVDPDIDFAGIFGRFDTLLMGRHTFEYAMSRGGMGMMPGMATVVVSRAGLVASGLGKSKVRNSPGTFRRSR